MSADPDLLAIWTRGWALTRGVPAPVRDGAAWRIEVGAADQLRRFVFGKADEDVARRAEAIDEPNVFLKVCAEADAVRPLLPPGWRIRPPGFLMRLDGVMPEGSLPDGCRTAFETVDGVLFCRLSLDGVEAARGRAVIVDGVTIFDRIAVEQAYRRRGLGGEVTRQLQAGTGQDRGVLVATADGHGLYASLGWRLHSNYTPRPVRDRLPFDQAGSPSRDFSLKSFQTEASRSEGVGSRRSQGVFARNRRDAPCFRRRG